MVADGKRTLAVIGDRVNHFIPNPTFDPIIVPGCLDLLFRGEIPEGVDPASLMKVDRLAEHPEYQNRDARVKVMDTQEHRDGVHAADVRLRCRGGLEARHRGDDGVGACIQPVARRGLGLRPTRSPDHRGADHLAGRPRKGRRGGRIRAGARRQDGAGAARAGAGCGQAAVVGRSASTTRCGRGWPRPAFRWAST